MIITLTESAQQQFLHLLQSKNKRAIKISVETKGCSGKAYTLMYIEEKDPLDEVITLADNAFLYIDPKAMLFMLGTEIDYEINDVKAEFVFRNPNEKGRCGCGKSFYA